MEPINVKFTAAKTKTGLEESWADVLLSEQVLGPVFGIAMIAAGVYFVVQVL